MADAVEPEGAENRGDLKGQASLFSAMRVGVRARAESPVVDADDAAIEQRFGRGRPKGASNIATTKRLELFARIGGDPLLASARILAMSTAELAGMLGSTALEAERFRQVERGLALPYVISKRPQEVNLNTNVPPALHLHFPMQAVAPGQALPLGAGGAVALLEHQRKLIQGEILPPVETSEETEA